LWGCSKANTVTSSFIDVNGESSGSGSGSGSGSSDSGNTGGVPIDEMP